MKLIRSLLDTLIELPPELADVRALARELDDLGLEVKGWEKFGLGADIDWGYEIETLANRGDHAAHLGVARELAARLDTPVKLPKVVEDLPDQPCSVPVTIDVPGELCPRYTIVEVPKIKAEDSPDDVADAIWKLTGRDPLGNLVDVTNFINAELGQPMHAFDKALIKGGIHVRQAENDIKVEALDGKEYTVPKGALLIHDDVKPVAVAGVIGLNNSACSESTTSILIESALFDPVSVRLTARAMGCATDASFRFERGGDAEMVILAQKRAVHLLGAKATGFNDVYPHVIEPRDIQTDLDTIAGQLGVDDVEGKDLKKRLEHLGFGVALAKGKSKKFTVTVPPGRVWDMETNQDVAEEYAKVTGYNTYPNTLPPAVPGSPLLTPEEELWERVKPVLHSHGFFEVMGSAFYNASVAEPINALLGHDPHVTMMNAVDKKNSHLKTTDLPALLDILGHNVNKAWLDDVRVYEFCRLFERDEENKETGTRERDVLTLLAYGPWERSSRGPRKPADMTLLRGMLSQLAGVLHVPVTYEPGQSPLLHPSRQAHIIMDGQPVGVMGEVLPELARTAVKRGRPLYVELDAAVLRTFLSKSPRFKALAEFPGSAREVTMLVPPGLHAADVIGCLQEDGDALLVDTQVSAQFQKKDEAEHRVTFRLTYRAPDRTLTNEEVEERSEKAIARTLERFKLVRG